jgi:hypothetical protein
MGAQKIKAGGEHPGEQRGRNFTTFQDLELSVWQSSVNEIFVKPEEKRERVMDATNLYCQASLNSRPDEPPGEWLGRLQNRMAVVSGFHHLLAVAEDTRNQGLFAALADFDKKTGVKKYEEGHDPGWAKCVTTYVRYMGQHRKGKIYRAWTDQKAGLNFSVIRNPRALRDSAVIAILGDWGTGEYEAVNVLRAIAAMKPDLILHLGDIYYSGTPAECDQHFLKIIRRQARLRCPVFTLAGNHDYYAAGTGYHWLIDRLNGYGWRQEASYFCLRNRHWQFLAMDTGYNDAVPGVYSAARKLGCIHDTSLRTDELYWHWDKLRTAGGRKTILLSHHQLFSAYEKIGGAPKGDSHNPNLLPGFAPYFKGGGGKETEISAWLWGHEHDYLSYNPGHKGLQLGVCIGHGAIPVRCADKPKKIPSPYDGLPPGLKKHALTSTANYYNNGFSILQLKGPNAKIHHFEIDSFSRPKPIGSDVIS